MRNSHIFRAEVSEAEFDDSTSMEFEVEDNIVTDVEDTSMFETKSYWDHWSPRELNVKGMSLREAYQVLSSEFDDFEDENRNP